MKSVTLIFVLRINAVTIAAEISTVALHLICCAITAATATATVTVHVKLLIFPIENQWCCYRIHVLQNDNISIGKSVVLLPYTAQCQYSQKKINGFAIVYFKMSIFPIASK